MQFLTASESKLVLKRLWTIVKPYWVSPQGKKAWMLLVGVLALLIGVSLVNVFINSVAGRFTTALQARDASAFWTLLWMYAGALVFATPIIVFYQFLRSKLALMWRKWLTQHLVSKYFYRRSYFNMSTDPHIDNPDERMSQDVETFCNMTVGLSITILDALVTIVTFIAVLWSISGALTIAVVAYSLFGSVLTVVFGKRLVQYNFDHLKLEADLRYNLVDVRRDVESIAFYGGEKRAKLQVFRAIGNAIKNQELVMILNRNLGFFTHSYNALVVLIPPAIIAPLYFSGQMEFGEMTRAGMAFAQIFGAMTLFVVQFNAISAYIANINRVGSFMEALEVHTAPATIDGMVIDSAVGGQLSLEHLSVLTPGGERTLLKDCTLTVAPGQSLLIMGPSGAGKSSILRAIAGLWVTGHGRVVRPSFSDMMFLPQRPYVPASTLRDALCYPRTRSCATDSELIAHLKLVNLADLPARVGGLDVERNWREFLSVGEQQRLSFARLLMARPRYAIVDEATSALDVDNEKLLYTILAASGSTLISVGHRPSLLEHHTLVLELIGDGSWRLTHRN